MRPLTSCSCRERPRSTNNCIGIGDVVAAATSRLRPKPGGRLEPLGFTEDLVNLAEPTEADADAG
jgi:hypothetical protein